MAESVLLTILDALTEAAFVIDSGRRVVNANRSAEQVFGPGLAGTDFVRIVRHPDCISAINRVLEGAGRARAIITLEMPARTIFDINVASLGEDEAAGGRALITMTDISHVREAEQMRSDFVANVSHELRSPLTALAGFIETLRGPARDDAEARERFLDLMDHEAQRMVRLIADLLSLSKVEVNARLRPSGTADVASILKRVVTMLGDHARRERKTIDMSISKDIAPVPGDEDELTQVFQNLIENAIKYGAADTAVRIEAEPRSAAAGFRGPVLAVSIIDTGPGIAPEHIPRLTERFYRADPGRSRDKGGTGLGLAIVKHIVNRHRGRLQILSEVGEGSRFTVLLPASAEKGSGAFPQAMS